MKNTTTRLLVMISSVMLFLFISNGGFSATRGVTDDTILVGSTQALSGPAAMLSLVGKGVDAYFKMINERGGVYDRKIKFIIEDDQNDGARGVAATRKLVERDRVFALVGVMSSGSTMATVQYLQQRKIPLLSGVSTSDLVFPPKKYIFSFRPACSVEGRLLARYALDKLKAKRIGIFYQDSNFGIDALDGVMFELNKRSIKPVVLAPFRVEDMEYSSQLLKLKQAKPDLIIMLSSFRNSGGFLAGAEKMGLKTTFLAMSVNNTPILTKLAGASAVEGVITTASMKSIRSKSSQMKDYLANFNRYYPKENRYNTLPQVGWSAAMIFVEALKRTGRDLTVDKFIEAMESLKDWDEGLANRVTYNPERRDGQRSLRMCQFKKGRAISISDYIELDF